MLTDTAKVSRLLRFTDSQIETDFRKDRWADQVRQLRFALIPLVALNIASMFYAWQFSGAVWWAMLPGVFSCLLAPVIFFMSLRGGYSDRLLKFTAVAVTAVLVQQALPVSMNASADNHYLFILPMLTVIWLFGLSGLNFATTLLVSLLGLAAFNTGMVVTGNFSDLAVVNVALLSAMLLAGYSRRIAEMARRYLFLYKLALVRERQRLMQMSRTDPLTGLPLRSFFDDRLKNALLHSASNGSSLAVLVIGVDNLKRINEQSGHAAGDGVIRRLAQNIRKVVRRSDVVARLGGDEVVVLLEGLANINDSRLIARKLLTELNQTARITADMQVLEMPMSVSLGISGSLGGQGTVDELLLHAGFAMREAKQRGGSAYCLYNQYKDPEQWEAHRVSAG